MDATHPCNLGQSLGSLLLLSPSIEHYERPLNGLYSSLLNRCCWWRWPWKSLQWIVTARIAAPHPPSRKYLWRLGPAPVSQRDTLTANYIFQHMPWCLYVCEFSVIRDGKLLCVPQWLCKKNLVLHLLRNGCIANRSPLQTLLIILMESWANVTFASASQETDSPSSKSSFPFWRGVVQGMLCSVPQPPYICACICKHIVLGSI